MPPPRRCASNLKPPSAMEIHLHLHVNFPGCSSLSSGLASLPHNSQATRLEACASSETPGRESSPAFGHLPAVAPVHQPCPASNHTGQTISSDAPFHSPVPTLPAIPKLAASASGLHPQQAFLLRSFLETNSLPRWEDMWADLGVTLDHRPNQTTPTIRRAPLSSPDSITPAPADQAR